MGNKSPNSMQIINKTKFCEIFYQLFIRKTNDQINGFKTFQLILYTRNKFQIADGKSHIHVQLPHVKAKYDN